MASLGCFVQSSAAFTIWNRCDGSLSQAEATPPTRGRLRLPGAVGYFHCVPAERLLSPEAAPRQHVHFGRSRAAAYISRSHPWAFGSAWFLSKSCTTAV